MSDAPVSPTSLAEIRRHHLGVFEDRGPHRNASGNPVMENNLA